jgi:NurA-like 5'-3' nuclease
MKTITIRLDDDVFNKIEEQRGTKLKSDFYRELIEYHLNKSDSYLNKNEYISIQSEYERIKTEYESNRTELQHQEAIRKIQDDRIRDLQNQVGFLQLEYQKVSDRLMLPAPDKKWWQFWK